jgi:hypothetical protein
MRLMALCELLMLSTSDDSLDDIAHRLRYRQLGAEHSPPALADLLDRLVRERAALGRQLRDLEQITTTQATAGAARNAYARGYREAQADVAAMVQHDRDLCAAIAALRPRFAEAGAAAQAV